MDIGAVTGSAVTYTVQLSSEQYGELYRSVNGVYLLLAVLVILEGRKLVLRIVEKVRAR